MRKHLVALLAVFMLLMAALPMQALAASAITTVYSSSTHSIQQGDTGRITLKIEAGNYVERVGYRFLNADGKVVVNTAYSGNHSTNPGDTRDYIVYVNTASMTAGDYTAEYWIEYRDSDDNWVKTTSTYAFDFEVIENLCSGSHKMVQDSINEPATCKKPGVALYACSECDYVEYREIPMAHTYDKGVCTKKPTTTVPGQMTYTCSGCGHKKYKAISVEEAIKIVTQPKAASAYENEKATVSVKATGKDLKYVWEYSDNGGSTWHTTSESTGRKASYSLTMTKARDGRLVRCKITNYYKDTMTTTAVKLDAKLKAKVTTQPKNATAYKDQKATVSVKASGDGIKYQWYYKNPGSSSFKKSSIITATAAVTMTKARDGRQMYCVVTDKYGFTAKSNTVTLSIREDAKIITQPKNASAYTNKAVNFTIKATGDGLKYQWQYRDSSSAAWKNASSTKNTYSPKMTKDRDGRQIRCVVKDQYGNTVTSNAVKMTLAAPKITTQPKSQTKEAGERAKFSVKATGDGLKYQWQYSTNGGSSWKNASSQKATYSPTVKSSHDGRRFRCVITDMYGKKVTSKTVKLTVE